MIHFMGTPKQAHQLLSDEVIPNLVIKIHMKKMDNSTNSGAGSSAWDQNSMNNNQPATPSDSNNNDGIRTSKSESACKGLYKLIFNKSSNNDTNNNNQSMAAPNGNSYTKVSVERPIIETMSQLNINQNRQIINQTQHGNANVKTQLDPNIRYKTSDDDVDERAREQRAIDIQEGIPLDRAASSGLFEDFRTLSASPMMLVRAEDVAGHRISRDSCIRCQQPEYKQLGIAQSTLIPLTDGEMPRIHSQDYYCHFLVPDLQKITACCYYWGKMDRYEAEKLLDGKPEGTFLLRDSAQDDYLFSVSFRKYGRSLHARIEQYNHKFSFDSHDPSVYTALTVTGLVEHYKDPSSVMFFEPMLTSPLHRNYVFSLQQLCRAAVVSHTTYDGINNLCLPASLKSYLKEYHYKLRVRVKQFPDGFCTTYQNS